MEKLVGTGKVRAIGISNFSIQILENPLKDAKIIPAVELDPLLAQADLVKYCLDNGIMLTAYSPTGYGQVPQHPEVIKEQEAQRIHGPDCPLLAYSTRLCRMPEEHQLRAPKGEPPGHGNPNQHR